MLYMPGKSSEPEHALQQWLMMPEIKVKIQYMYGTCIISPRTRRLTSARINITSYHKNIELALDWLVRTKEDLIQLIPTCNELEVHPLIQKIESQLDEAHQRMVSLIDNMSKDLDIAATSFGVDDISTRLGQWRAFQSLRQDCEICKTQSRLSLLDTHFSDANIKSNEFLDVLASRRVCAKHNVFSHRIGELMQDGYATEISKHLRGHGIMDWLLPTGAMFPFFITDTLIDGEMSSFVRSETMVQNLHLRRDILGRTMLHRILDLYKPLFRDVLRSLIEMAGLEGSHALSQQDSLGRTPLCIACQKGNTSAVQQLLGKGADPNIATHAGFLPLHLAAAVGSLETCQMLRNRPGVYVDACGPDGKMARDYALINGHFSAANMTSSYYTSSYYSLQKRTPPTDLDPQMLQGILRWSTDTVRSALAQNADPNALLDPTFTGGRQIETLFTMALDQRLQHYKRTFLLAEIIWHAGGVDLEARTERGETALHIFVRRCDEPAVRWLLEHDADYMARDGKGRTALMIAAKKNCPALVKMLWYFASCELEGSELLDAKDDDGHTAQDYAIWNKSLECSSALSYFQSKSDKLPSEDQPETTISDLD